MSDVMSDAMSDVTGEVVLLAILRYASKRDNVSPECLFGKMFCQHKNKAFRVTSPHCNESVKNGVRVVAIFFSWKTKVFKNTTITAAITALRRRRSQ